MAIAQRTDYWDFRFVGADPTDPVGGSNTAFSATGSGASSASGYRTITDEVLTATPTTSAYTAYAVFKYTAAPDDNEVLLRLDNNSKRVEVQSTGNTTSLKVVGATTQTYSGLDLTEYTPIRLTLDASGNAKLYVYEIVEDNSGVDNFKSVAGSSGSGKALRWGNTSGTVVWGNVYMSTMGAFNPNELSPSEFVNDTIIRLGFALRDQLRDSTRPTLKNFIDDSSIVYGTDMSSNMVNRVGNPAIYVVIEEISSPQFTVVGGSRADHDLAVQVFIVTRGADYDSAYRRSIDLAGDVLDELYVNTGLDANQDSLLSYSAKFDSRLDDDEIVCVHQLTFIYMRRMQLHRR